MFVPWESAHNLIWAMGFRGGYSTHQEWQYLIVLSFAQTLPLLFSRCCPFQLLDRYGQQLLGAQVHIETYRNLMWLRQNSPKKRYWCQRCWRCPVCKWPLWPQHTATQAHPPVTESCSWLQLHGNDYNPAALQTQRETQLEKQGQTWLNCVNSIETQP